MEAQQLKIPRILAGGGAALAGLLAEYFVQGKTLGMGNATGDARLGLWRRPGPENFLAMFSRNPLLSRSLRGRW